MLKKRQKIYFGLFWVLLVISFLFSATFLILVANGYHLNSKNLKLEKIGMIVLDGSPNNFNITINGTSKIGDFPYRLYNLFPGRYEIKIEKENYQSWGKVYQLNGGQAIVEERIFLFFKGENIIKKDEDLNLIAKVQKEFDKQNNSLDIVSNELTYQTKLITRFSNPVKAAIKDSRTEYFIVQVDNQIVAISEEGQNQARLITLENSEPSSFYMNGSTLFYLDNGKVKSAVVR